MKRYPAHLFWTGRKAFGALLLVSLLLLTASLAVGQATTGALAGVVVDRSGAVIAGAEVPAVEVATSWSSTVLTNREGVFSFPQLKAGLYKVTLLKEGFKSRAYEGVRISIAQNFTLNAALEVGARTETVTVSAGGFAQLQTEESQISGTLEAKAVEDLPSNPAGTGIDSLALLVGGVLPAAGGSNGNGATFSVNGNRSRANNFTIDGGDNNDLTVSGPAMFIDNSDTVSEFQILTSNFSAEYGRNQGSVVNVVTKSGTNTLHGTAAWFHRDDSFLNALDALQKQDPTVTGPPHALYNLWSGTLGGPAIKNKLFFFGSYQQMLNPKTVVDPIYNPTFAKDQLPLLASHSNGNVALQLLAKYSLFALPVNASVQSAFPSSTVTIGGVPYTVVYPSLTFDNRTSEQEPSGRIDYRINDRHNLWFRELYQKKAIKNGDANSSGWVGDAANTSQLTTASWNWQLSNSSFNELRFIRNRLDVTMGGGCSGINCIPTPSSIDQTFTRVSFNGIKDAFGSNLLPIGPPAGQPQGRLVTVYQLSDNLSRIAGSHQLKFGIDFHRNTNKIPLLKYSNGSFIFTSASQLQNNAPIAVGLAVGSPIITYNESDIYLYAQDNWKVKSNLTLNLGLRWEYSGQPLNVLHDLTMKRESNPATAIWLQSLPLSDRTFPSYASDKNNFAPRLGFSWTPKESRTLRPLLGGANQTVISGGYSISYEPAYYEMMLLSSQGAPFTFLNTTYNFPGQPVTFPIPAVDATQSIVQAYAKTAGIVQTNTFAPQYLNQTSPVKGFHSPFSEQWSLRVQREFGRNETLAIAYVGNHGVGLFSYNNGNPYVRNLVNGFTEYGLITGSAYNFPGFGSAIAKGAVPITCAPTATDPQAACDGRVSPVGMVGSYGNEASSSYHSLQVHYSAQIRNQLTISASYTWSKSLDDGSETDAISSPASSANPFDRSYDRSYSDFDRRNNFAMYASWQSPSYKGKSALLANLVGNWQLNMIWNWANGSRYTPESYTNAYLLYTGGYVDGLWDQNMGSYDSVRPFVANMKAPSDRVAINSIDADLIGKLPAGVVPTPKLFLSLNTLNSTGTAETVTLDQVRYVLNGPAAAQYFGNPFGTVRRNSAIGPTLNNVNLSVFKNVTFHEGRVKLQLRLEGFNAFNHPNPGVGFAQGQTVPNPFIDVAGSPGGFAQTSAMRLSARVVQVGAKVQF